MDDNMKEQRVILKTYFENKQKPYFYYEKRRNFYLMKCDKCNKK